MLMAIQAVNLIIEIWRLKTFICRYRLIALTIKYNLKIKSYHTKTNHRLKESRNKHFRGWWDLRQRNWEMSLLKNKLIKICLVRFDIKEIRKSFKKRNLIQFTHKFKNLWMVSKIQINQSNYWKNKILLQPIKTWQ